MGFIQLSTFRTDADTTPQARASHRDREPDKIKERNEIQRREPESPRQENRIVSRNVRDSDLPFIGASEVQLRNGEESNRLWIVVNRIVLDVTEYIDRHPGGRQIVQGFGGQDCTWQWWALHGKQTWDRIARDFRVGRTEGVKNMHQRPQPKINLPKFGYQDWE